MRLDHLWLTDFRNYQTADLALAGTLTVVVGSNGAGKTNLLEAVGYLATLSSFRGAPPEALVRLGSEQAIVRGEGGAGERAVLIEAEVRAGGRGRVSVNRQAVRRVADLGDQRVRVSVFSPNDLVLVKGPPAGRRRWLDDALVALHPRNDALRRDFERVVRQRSTLLTQAGGRLTPDVATTLDVWDTKLTQTGEALADARVELLERAGPLVAKAYEKLAGAGPLGATASGAVPNNNRGAVGLRYLAPWRNQGLAAALEAARTDELRRGVSLVGPHRDDVELSVGGLAARTHASQGEQRTLALALRLGAHEVVATTTGDPPLLLLDDVFSELDQARSRALLEHLPPGQAVLSTTGSLPPGVEPELVVEVADGRVVERGPQGPSHRDGGR